jgi:hypothetical protein
MDGISSKALQPKRTGYAHVQLHQLCHYCAMSHTMNVVRSIRLASERRQIGVALMSFKYHNQN